MVRAQRRIVIMFDPTGQKFISIKLKIPFFGPSNTYFLEIIQLIQGNTSDVFSARLQRDNICFHGELSKIILQISSNTILVCSTALWMEVL